MTGKYIPETVVKVWVKDDNMRMESALGPHKNVTIIRKEGMYTYLPAQNILTKVPRVEEAGQGGVKNPLEYIEYLKARQAKKVGSEVVNGYKCSIYSYKDDLSGSDVTVWVWETKKFPVKVNIKGMGEDTTVVFSDIKLNEPVSNDLFQLPKDAKVMDLSGMFGQ